jgi:hypothetical protein
MNLSTSVSRFGGGRRERLEANLTALSLTDTSAVRVDTALLASALFLQRFTLHFGGSVLGLDFVPATLIVAHQFASGRLFVQYDRLLWFLVLVVAATASWLLNADSADTRRTSYGLFVVIYSLFTLARPSTRDQYKGTLRAFQFLVLILSWLAIVQFLAHFIVDPRRLVMFFGIFPDSLLTHPGEAVEIGVKSNGIFLAEASTMSQIAALGIIVEVLEFHRPRYLVVLTLGLLLAYSGTGMTILLLSLPLAALVNPKAQLPAIVVTLFALVLFATGFIHLSMFTSRLGEFQDPHASGFMRYVSSFWQAADYFKTASLPELLFGNGPGYGFVRAAFYASSSTSWFKLFLEYGAFGAFVFTCFFTSCFRRSRCPKPLIVALIYDFLFPASNLLGTSLSVMLIVLCTLSGREPRRFRLNEAGEYPSSLVTRSTAV